MTETITFQNALLIDGNGGDPKQDATVVVSNGKIKEILNTREKTDNPKGRELALKAEVMTPMEEIVSATRTAELIRMSNLTGALEPGKLADISVLDGNPLKDMKICEHGIKKILLVVKEGRIMKNLM